MRPERGIGLAFVLTAVVAAAPGADQVRFYPDDPLAVEPETQDASHVAPRDIDLIWDLAAQLIVKPGDPTLGQRARNVNSIDEVPDSSWFTNRILRLPITEADIARGPLHGDGPAPGPWTITHPKTSGFAPGFRIRDGANGVWFVSLDARGMDEAATGAIAVANKLFWALGYWQTENFLVTFRAEDLRLAPTARMRAPSGRQRPMRQRDVDEVLARAARGRDGSYRAIASRGLPGTIVGGFRYDGTRPDDPNDVVPHEHRRELRALRVFGAWLNLVDMKAGNTLDTVVPGADGRRVVRHYLQDVGSTLGTGANGPRDFDEGWESLVNLSTTWRRLVSIGLYLQPWQTVPYLPFTSVGRFEGARFDPVRWSPRVPPAAFRHAREDDTFWAARRVAAVTDGMIRAAVDSGHYSDPNAAAHLVRILIARRDKIARAYLPVVLPIVEVALDDRDGLTFGNAAEAAGVAAAPADGYRAQWYRFDNATGVSTPVGDAVSVRERRVPLPPALAGDAYVRVDLSAVDAAHPVWSRPVPVHFAHRDGRWILVGLTRQP